MMPAVAAGPWLVKPVFSWLFRGVLRAIGLSLSVATCLLLQQTC